jgi:hypothetical protein
VTRRPRVACFATQGTGSGDEARIVELLGDLEPVRLAFDPARKLANVPRLLRAIRRADLVVVEGTGAAGGAAVLLGRALFGVPYVVSSGDAVGPYLGGRRRALAVPGWLYEALLCRAAAGFVGWTPYLTGRALTLGCRRAMTAAQVADGGHPRLPRAEVRRRLGIPERAIVVGIAGSLNWNRRRGYCYGWELVSAMRRVRRSDVAALVVGGGTGVEPLRRLAGEDLGRRVFIPGPVAPELVGSYLAAMDVGSLPQSVDQVGAFRYTTKLPEYLAAGLPAITGQVPVAYDVLDGWSWRLPGDAPWDERYVAALGELLERVRPDDIARRRAAMPPRFSAADQRRRVGAFVRDVLDASA